MAIWLANSEQAPEKVGVRHVRPHLVGRPTGAGLLLPVARLPVVVIGIAILGCLLAGAEFAVESRLREIGLVAAGPPKLVLSLGLWYNLFWR